MSLLVLIDTPRQAAMVARRAEYRRAGTRLVALTAGACQVLDEFGVRYEPISALVDLTAIRTAEPDYIRSCLDLARNIETFVGDQDPTARFDGPGFLSGQIYHLQYSVGAILTRAFLMRMAIQASMTKEVHVFAEDVDPWFAGAGYARNPWLDTLAECTHARGVTLDVRPLPGIAAWSTYARRFRPGGSLTTRVKSGLRRVPWIRRWLAHRRSTAFAGIASIDGMTGLRVLFCGGDGWDWSPLARAMANSRDVEYAILRIVAEDSVGFRNRYSTSIEYFSGGRDELVLDVPCTGFDGRTEYVELFDAFVRAGGMEALPSFLGIDLKAVVSPLLRTLTGIGPGLVRHADATAAKALERINPQVACFTTISGVADRRFAFRCRERGIPVVCYQHGGSYGTHEMPPHGVIDASDADYFLTYGTGVLPIETPVLPRRARYIPVGSSRIEQMWHTVSGVSRSEAPLTVLWVAELSYRNTVAATHIVEDTARFQLQKECLRVLAAGPAVRVIYRPFPFAKEWQATPRWLSRTGLAAVTIDSSSTMHSLIANADVVVVDSAGSTVWNEVLALGKPLVVYCDSERTPLRPHFALDLDRACRWCKSREELLDAVKALANEPHVFINTHTSAGRADFLKHYVWHEGNCVSQVASFLCRVGRSGAPETHPRQLQ